MTDLNATWNESTRGPRMSEATGKVIFKYQMPVLEQFTMDLPVGAQIIRMQDMDGFFWLWAVVDTNAPMEKRHFRAFKTGAKIPDDFDTSHYVGFCAVFVQMELGLYIFEDLSAYRAAQGPATMSSILARVAKESGVPVVDIKMSEMNPSDMAGIPSFHCNEENMLKWFKEATAWMYEPKGKLTQQRIDEIEAQGGFEEEE